MALTAARQAEEQRQQVLHDLDSSLSALCKQRASMAEEAGAARAYAREVQARRERVLRQDREQGPVRSEGMADQGAVALSAAFASIMARLSAAEAGVESSSDNASLALQSADTSTFGLGGSPVYALCTYAPIYRSFHSLCTHR